MTRASPKNSLNIRASPKNSLKLRAYPKNSLKIRTSPKNALKILADDQTKKQQQQNWKFPFKVLC